MDERWMIYLDATEDSQALELKDNPLFNSWLHPFNNIPAAFKFINEKHLPYGTDVYLSKDNILDNGLPDPISGQMRSLIKTFDELQSIRHVTVFSSDTTADIEVQIRAILIQPRMLLDVIRVNDLQFRMCTTGIEHLQKQINHYKTTEQAHLIKNPKRNIAALYEHLGRLITDQNQELDAIEVAHSNKLSTEES